MKTLFKYAGFVTAATMFVTLMFITLFLSSNSLAVLFLKIAMPFLFFALNYIIYKYLGKKGEKNRQILLTAFANLFLGAVFVFLLKILP